MPGTAIGGQHAAATNKKRHGDDFYENIGKIGGRARNKLKGFGSNTKLASEAGRLGGKKSKRGKAKAKWEQLEPNKDLLDNLGKDLKGGK